MMSSRDAKVVQRLMDEAFDVNVKIGNIEIGKDKPLLVIAGPCMAESWDLVYNTAKALKDISQELGFALLFKSSFDKANRTSNDSYRGPGLEDGLKMLADIKRQLGVPVISDVHETTQCLPAGEVLDCLQIPAFLCRQTDLVVAAARTGKAVAIKKGQFLSPQEMRNNVKKVTDTGNENVFVMERGTTFGYNNLVVDFRSIPMMQQFGKPVIFDATHSVQLPGGSGDSSGGQRQYITTLARAAIAAGCDGLFMEVHPVPDDAKSDAATQVPLSHAKELIRQCLKIREVVGEFPEFSLPAFQKKSTKAAVL
jgi:2-dehydro-3-deoxyphosphooctonate aldolase (KDO 8-P synthase)